MKTELLKVVGLQVEISKNQTNTLIKSPDFVLCEGETVVITGANGIGKSTVGRAIMGDEKLIVRAQTMAFCGEDFRTMPTAERAKRGMFRAPQEIVRIDGLSYKETIRAALEERGEKLRGLEFKKQLTESLEKLGLDPFMAEKSIGGELSGGEKKKMEIVELLMLRPKVAILDEIDSGLDAQSIKNLTQILKTAQEEWGLGLVIITHGQKIFENLKVVKEIKISQAKLA